MAEGSSNEQRVGYANVTQLDFPVTFGGKTYTNKVVKTSLGEFLITATQLSMLLTGADDISAFDHFRTVSKRCTSLQHNGELLQDHVRVRDL
jgi:hypothetical protein